MLIQDYVTETPLSTYLILSIGVIPLQQCIRVQAKLNPKLKAQCILNIELNAVLCGGQR